jgi:hypothetical protein
MKLDDWIKPHDSQCLAGKYSTMGRCSCGRNAALENLYALRKSAQQGAVALDLIEAIDRYRVAHSAFEASGERTAELNDAYVNLLLSCDLAKALGASSI